MHTIAHHGLMCLCSVLPPLLAIATSRKIRKKSDPEFVRDAREKLGLTQLELADKLGMERRTIMRYENGSSRLLLHVRFALKYLLYIRRKKKRGR